MKVLITGFEPFGSRNINMSWEVVRCLKGRPETDILRLPVRYDGASGEVVSRIAGGNYDLVVMVGETSATPDSLRLERVALNLMDATMADNAGIVADETPVCPGGSPAYFSRFPCKSIVRRLKAEGKKVKVSNTAGTFVCNCLYYNVMKYIEDKGLNTVALFVHVPSTEERISLSEMKETVQSVISNFRNGSL